MYEFDRTNLTIDPDFGLVVFDGDSIAAILEPKLDIAEKLQLDQKGPSSSDVTFSVIAYADGSLISAQVTGQKDGGEEHYAYELSQGEEKELWNLLEDFCQQTYGCSLKDYPTHDQLTGRTSMQEVNLT